MTFSRVATLLIVTFLAACDEPEVRTAQPHDVPAPNPPPDEVSCIPREQTPLAVSTTRLRESNLDDSTENPLIITDAAVDASGTIFALDASEYQVRVLDATGKQIRAWGKRGGGPGEFLQPVAISLNTKNRVYVFEQRGRAQVFSETGDLIRTFRFPFEEVADAVVLGNDEIIVVANVDVRAPVSSPYALRLDSAGKELSQLLVADSRTMNRRPLLAALFNKVRVARSQSGHVAVWYVFDRYADVFMSDGRHITVEGCMDPGVERWYRAQRKDNARGTTSVVAVSGIVFDGNELVMAGPGTKDRNSELQITRYSGPNFKNVANYNATKPRNARLTAGMSFINDSTFITWGVPFPSIITKWTMRQ